MADRSEPQIARRVAQTHVLGGVNYGGVITARSATGQVVRNDRPMLTRLPVASIRPIWHRLSLLGLHSEDTVPESRGGLDRG